MKDITQIHWDYFLLLEKDLITISETLDLCEKNYRAFGPKIVQLILSAGSELDASLKSFAKIVDPECDAATKQQPNMSDFKIMIVGNVGPYFSSAKVKILRTDIRLSPWEAVCQSPSEGIKWWSEYNAVKHRRAERYEDGTLEIALDLLSALFVVDAYLLEATNSIPYGFTQIMDWDDHESIRGKITLRR